MTISGILPVAEYRPWNKGRLIGQKRPSHPNMSGRSASDLRWREIAAASLCSTWRLQTAGL